MTERRVAVRTIRVTMPCPAEGCAGEMRSMFMQDATRPPKYRHECPVCGRQEPYLKRYPAIEYEPMEVDEEDQPSPPCESQPMQPLVEDEHGVVRFRANAIVRFLLDAGPFDMNRLAVMPFNQADYEQFAQLIGYSVCGFCDLSYASEEIKDRAWAEMERLTKQDSKEVK